MFEVVVRRTGLAVAIAEQATFRPGTQDPFSSVTNGGYDADGGSKMGLDLGSADPFNGSFSHDFLTEMGLDIPFLTMETTADLANGDNIFQRFLSPDQWNIPFGNPG